MLKEKRQGNVIIEKLAMVLLVIISIGVFLYCLQKFNDIFINNLKESEEPQYVTSKIQGKSIDSDQSYNLQTRNSEGNTVSIEVSPAIYNHSKIGDTICWKAYLLNHSAITDPKNCQGH